ncbi:Rsp5p-dependent ubiquitination, sorting of cargo proteins at the multivesicular body [Terramyces sp. JEL0728]|nr:Rsp5p-dependent ubiquitination, sorting of cargo proteins at the multivesicular body [Terramyces sp. JEL0728]
MKTQNAAIATGLFSFTTVYNQLDTFQFKSTSISSSISGYSTPNTRQISLANAKVFCTPYLSIPTEFLQNYFTQYTNTTSVYSLYTNLNEDFILAGSGSVYDKVLYSGQANITTDLINLVFENTTWTNEFISSIVKLNETLGKKTNIDSMLNTSPLFSSTLSPVSVDNMNVTFFGRIGSIVSKAILFGQFNLTSTSIITQYRFDNYQISDSSKIAFNNISRIYFDNGSISLTAGKSLFNIDFNVSQSQGTITGSTSFNFNGAASYTVNIVDSSNPLDSVSTFFPFAMLFLFITIIYFVHQKFFRNQIADLRTRFEQQDLQDRVTRADEFLAFYQPDSEEAILALNADCPIPESMEGVENAITMLLVRHFDDYEFEDPPYVKIDKMTKYGTQTVEFMTEQECCIQSNACLKPRDVFSNGPQPPPSFNSDSINQECYFELKILLNNDSNISVGFTTCPYPPFRLPGYDLYSIGYHSSTGRVYLNDRKEVGIECGEELKEGDVLGIGYRIIEYKKIESHTINQTVFYFTHNGTRIGDEFVADGFFPEKIYPSVGCTGDCIVSLNFGTPKQVFYKPTEFSIQEFNYLPVTEKDAVPYRNESGDTGHEIQTEIDPEMNVQETDETTIS